MQAVEEKVRGAADSGRPRAVAENPMLTSLRAAAEKAADQLAKAKAAGTPSGSEPRRTWPAAGVPGRRGEGRRAPLSPPHPAPTSSGAA